jgi:hypothetical protein
MHDRMIGSAFAKAKRSYETSFQEVGKAINEKVRLYAKVGQALIEAKETGNDPFAAIEQILSWLSAWHIRDETYSKALAGIVNYHHRQPFATHWGEGTTSSSDGQRFRAGGRGEEAGQVNLRYGTEPGVLFYTLVSDQYAPFHTKVINATVRDATHVLDGLLYHESELKIEEHYTDTAKGAARFEGAFISRRRLFSSCFSPGDPEVEPVWGYIMKSYLSHLVLVSLQTCI